MKPKTVKDFEDVEDPYNWDMSDLAHQQETLMAQMYALERDLNAREENDSMIKMIAQFSHKVSEDRAQRPSTMDQNFLQKRIALKNILKGQKIRAIVNNFRQKATRGLSHSTPIEYDPYDKP